MSKLTPEQCQMVEDNLGLAYFAANKFRNKFNIEYDDILSLCFEGLTRAAKGFDVNRGIKFSTYAMKTMFFTSLTYLKPKKPQVETIYLEDLINESGESFWNQIMTDNVCLNDLAQANFIESEIIKLINGDILKPKQKEILKLRYENLDITQIEIGKRIGCTQKHVHCTLSVIHDKMKPLWEAI